MCYIECETECLNTYWGWCHPCWDLANGRDSSPLGHVSGSTPTPCGDKKGDGQMNGWSNRGLDNWNDEAFSARPWKVDLKNQVHAKWKWEEQQAAYRWFGDTMMERVCSLKYTDVLLVLHLGQLRTLFNLSASGCLTLCLAEHCTQDVVLI